jgi:hypothetical protein
MCAVLYLFTHLFAITWYALITQEGPKRVGDKLWTTRFCFLSAVCLLILIVKIMQKHALIRSNIFTDSVELVIEDFQEQRPA